ncbi:hypothetical protein ACFQ0X_43705 [Streptomyces rectiviolaceus]|uniref:Uncharacterized protein n=1 Tax=Streptomyces rectiviolaceus TaxID=332591 RepID=A0ABP6NMJ4_9ACTN
MANQAEHYNAGQAKAVQKGPMHVITFWTNVCRKVAKDALENGDPSVANRLASQLHDFYRSHGQ